MANRFETYFVAYYAYFTSKLNQFKKKQHYSNFKNMSTWENIRLIARTPLFDWSNIHPRFYTFVEHSYLKPQLHIPDSGYDSDETYIVKSGWLKQKNSEIPTMSHDVPTVSLRLLYDSWRCYYDATSMSLRCYYDATTAESRHNRRTVVLHSWWIGMNLDESGGGGGGWIVMTDDTLINLELPRMTTNTTTMPLGMIPIPLQ